MKIRRRRDLAKQIPQNGLAIELGVARGDFSIALLREAPQMRRLYSVDRWSGERGHGDLEYVQAATGLSKYGDRSIILRMTFDHARKILSDGIFDLVYIDGYAHQGQQNRVLDQWWSKLKLGGILAGHDYCPKWPLTMKTVDDFVSHQKLALHVTEEPVDEEKGIYPSWYVRKEEQG
jgi:predicted O-methyltransferase YrrM